MRFLIVTDQVWVWDKLTALKELTQFEFDIRYAEFTPEVKEGRITEIWFQSNITNTAFCYDGAVFLCSLKEAKKWKLKDGLRGSHFRDGDAFIECWASSDEKSVIKFKDGSKRDRAIKVIGHEIGHGLEETGKTTLDIHKYDFESEINNIEGFYKAFHAKPVLPVAAQYWDKPSQGYGVPNSIYPQTGVHIGVDLPCPVGTEVRARYTGEITETGKSAVLGNYCHFEYTVNGKKFVDRYLHLREIPQKGKFPQGNLLAITGATGMVTGPHLHIDTWRDRVRLSEIGKQNWASLTVDPRLVDKL